MQIYGTLSQHATSLMTRCAILQNKQSKNTPIKRAAIRNNFCAGNDSSDPIASGTKQKNTDKKMLLQTLKDKLMTQCVGRENYNTAVAKYGDFGIRYLSKMTSLQERRKILPSQNLPYTVFCTGEFALNPDHKSIEHAVFMTSFVYSVFCSGISDNIHQQVIWEQYNIFNKSKNLNALKTAMQLINMAYIMRELNIPENNQILLLKHLGVLILQNKISNDDMTLFNRELIDNIATSKTVDTTTAMKNFRAIVAKHLGKHNSIFARVNAETSDNLAAGAFAGAAIATITTVAKMVVISKL